MSFVAVIILWQSIGSEGSSIQWKDHRWKCNAFWSWCRLPDRP